MITAKAVGIVAGIDQGQRSMPPRIVTISADAVASHVAPPLQQGYYQPPPTHVVQQPYYSAPPPQPALQYYQPPPQQQLYQPPPHMVAYQPLPPHAAAYQPPPPVQTGLWLDNHSVSHVSPESHIRDAAWRTDQRDLDQKRAQQERTRMELQRQIDERKAQKDAKAAELKRIEAREAAEERSYNPFGRGGGGAPLRDAEGNLQTDLRHVKPDRSPAARSTAEALYGAPDREGAVACLNRVKPGETLVEARSDTDVQIVRQI